MPANVAMVFCQTLSFVDGAVSPLVAPLGPVGHAWGWAGTLLARLMLGIVNALGSMKYAAIPTATPGTLAVIGYYMILYAALGYARSKYVRDKRYLVIAAAVVLVVAVWAGALFPSQRVLTATFLDVGQGLCAVNQTPSNKVMVMDCGTSTLRHPEDVGKTVVVPYLQSQGIDNIDIAVLSHPHSDHVSGFAGLLEAKPGEDRAGPRSQLAIAALQEIPAGRKKLRRELSHCKAGARPWTWATGLSRLF